MPILIEPTWKRLADAIKETGLTQEELAEKVGVTQGAISLWLNGERIPRKRQMQSLSVALAIPMHDLLNDAAEIFLRRNIINE